jgi:hypothetical protein
MSLWRRLLWDEGGSVLSAEAVLLGGVLAVGATTGLKMAGDAVHGEFSETAYSLRSLDQSYYCSGFRGCNAATAGSCFIQRPVEESLAELRALEEKESRVEQKKADEKKATDPPALKQKKKQLKPKKNSSKPEGNQEAAAPAADLRNSFGI